MINVLKEISTATVKIFIALTRKHLSLK